MLKNIPAVLSPDLIKTMMEMGHGDEIVIADGNCSIDGVKRVIRLDGQGVVDILDAVLKFMPLDQYSKAQVTLMSLVAGDTQTPLIWEDFRETVGKYDNTAKIDFIERFDFYDRMKNAYAVVATGETAIYANIILKKGIV